MRVKIPDRCGFFLKFRHNKNAILTSKAIVSVTLTIVSMTKGNVRPTRGIVRVAMASVHLTIAISRLTIANVSLQIAQFFGGFADKIYRVVAHFDEGFPAE